MILRPAETGDLARLAPLAAEFYASSKFLKRFDMKRFTCFWAPLIESGAGKILLLDDGARIAGALGGVVYPEPYSGELTATEFFWFVAAGERGRGMELYRAFEAWARERECTEIRMVHLLDSMPQKLSAIYKRLGYAPAETHYVKGL